MAGEEWGPESWNGDMWEDPDEAGNIEPLNSDGSFLTLDEISPFPNGAAFHPQ